MWIEAFADKEKKSKEFDEKKEKEKIREHLEFSEKKEILREKLEATKKINNLKASVEVGFISVELAKILSNSIDNIDQDIEIKAIFDKIDEMESIKNIDHILPINLRLNKEEIKDALNNENNKKILLQKIDNSLIHLYNTTHPFADYSIINFSSIVQFFNKNLVVVQENLIDIKNDLITKNI